MGKPAAPLSWATDANFVDPGKPWNGQPTKVAPLAGAQAQGHLPAKKPPAEYENWFKNNAGLWAQYLEQFAGHGVHSPLDFQGTNVTLNGDPSGQAGPIGEAFLHAHPAGGSWSPMKYAVPGLKIATVDFVVRGRAVNPGDAVTVRLMRQKNDGSPMEIVVGLAHVCAITGAWDTASLVANHDVAAGYAYWLAVVHGDFTDLLEARVTPG
jgi:hypothetical protein